MFETLAATACGWDATITTLRPIRDGMCIDWSADVSEGSRPLF